MSDQVPLPEKILHLLAKEAVPMTALQVSRAVLGKGSSRKMVNPTLYRLEKDGKVSRIEQVEGPPLWTTPSPQ